MLPNYLSTEGVMNTRLCMGITASLSAIINPMINDQQ